MTCAVLRAGLADCRVGRYDELKRAPVELLNRKRRQLDIFKTTGVDHDHLPASENTFGKCMNPARWAEAMFNGLTAECVGGHIFRRRE